VADSFNRPTENPDTSPAVAAVVNTSIINKNRRGEIRSPWCNPLDAEKNSKGESLTSARKEAEEIQLMTKRIFKQKLMRCK